jgi:NitT/TauT family transport system permease protein
MTVELTRDGAIATEPSTEASAQRKSIDDELIRTHKRNVRRRRTLVIGLRLLLIAAFLLTWEYGVGDPNERFVLVDEYYVSRPSLILEAITTWIERGQLFDAILSTMGVALRGLFIGGLLGLFAGFMLGVKPLLAAVLNPFVSALYSIPRLALIPLFMLWFGIGGGAKVAMVAVIVFFFIFNSTFSGVMDVDPGLVDTLRIMRAKKRHIYRKVILPSAMSWIVSGLRISVPYALVAAVTSEMLSGNGGLGFLLIRSAGQFYTAGVFGAIVVMMALGMTTMILVEIFDRRVLRWKPKAKGRISELV